MTLTPTSPESSRFTRPQIKVLLLLFLMNLLNYMDRNALSVVAPLFRRELHLSPLDYAYAVNGFLIALRNHVSWVRGHCRPFRLQAEPGSLRWGVVHGGGAPRGSH